VTLNLHPALVQYGELLLALGIRDRVTVLLKVKVKGFFNKLVEWLTGIDGKVFVRLHQFRAQAQAGLYSFYVRSRASHSRDNTDNMPPRQDNDIDNS
jgi:hypothetical protein